MATVKFETTHRLFFNRSIFSQSLIENVRPEDTALGTIYRWGTDHITFSNAKYGALIDSVCGGDAFSKFWESKNLRERPFDFLEAAVEHDWEGCCQMLHLLTAGDKGTKLPREPGCASKGFAHILVNAMRCSPVGHTFFKVLALTVGRPKPLHYWLLLHQTHTCSLLRARIENMVQKLQLLVHKFGKGDRKPTQRLPDLYQEYLWHPQDFDALHDSMLSILKSLHPKVCEEINLTGFPSEGVVATEYPVVFLENLCAGAAYFKTADAINFFGCKKTPQVIDFGTFNQQQGMQVFQDWWYIINIVHADHLFEVKHIGNAVFSIGLSFEGWRAFSELEQLPLFVNYQGVATRSWMERHLS